MNTVRNVHRLGPCCTLHPIGGCTVQHQESGAQRNVQHECNTGH